MTPPFTTGEWILRARLGPHNTATFEVLSDRGDVVAHNGIALVDSREEVLANGTLFAGAQDLFLAVQEVLRCRAEGTPGEDGKQSYELLRRAFARSGGELP